MEIPYGQPQTATAHLQLTDWLTAAADPRYIALAEAA
jgi:hypothetical protein